MLRPVTQGRQAQPQAPREAAGARLEAKRTQVSLSLWPWAELARRHGLPIERLAELAGIRVADLRDPGVRFTQAAADRVAELVCAHAGPDAPIEAAEIAEAGHFALFELLARTAPNVGRALAQGCRFFFLLHGDVRCVHRVEPDGGHQLRLVMPPDFVIHRGFTEFTFAMCTTSMRREAEQPAIEPLEVHFRHSARLDRTAYDRVFGPNVKFDMLEDQIRFSAAVVSLPLTRKNPTLHAAALHAAKDFLRMRK
jgi:hypothetical protein